MNEMKMYKKSSLCALLAGLGLGLAITSALAQSGYLVNSYGEVVMTGSRECWSVGGGLNPPVAACGDVIEVAAVEELDRDGDGVPDGKDRCADTPRGVAVDKRGCPKDSDGDGVADNRDKCPGSAAGVKVDMDGCRIIEDLVLQVTTDHFKFDSSRLEPGMILQLDELVAKIAASPGNEKLQIVGHTDSTGPDVYNLALSKRRAQSVADYLVLKGLVPANQIVEGMGEYEPVADNATKRGRALNRRVEIRTH